MIRVIGRILSGLLTFVGLMTVIVITGGMALFYWGRDLLEVRAPLPSAMLLALDLREEIAETPSSFPLALPLSGPNKPTVTEIVLKLEQARNDPRVKGLIATIDETRHGFAVAQEIRQAVTRFRTAGKLTVAWSDSFSELGSGLEGYYLASAFEEIVLQPVGTLGTAGIALEMPFARGLLDKLGIEPDVLRREEYKTALESFTETAPTPANREMMEALLDSLWGSVTADIAQARKLDPARAEELLGMGPYGAEAARAQGLVDRVAYQDETREAAVARAGNDVVVVEFGSYRRTRSGEAGETEVALIRAGGAILRGSGDVGREIAADDLAETVKKAVDDTGIRALVLRLDSPGGSAVASETIARQLRNAKARGKPVIVSMGNTAASGGYWISMDASRIVAQPMTLTGSIGVVAGKPVIAEAAAKVGIDVTLLTRGEHADLWSLSRHWPEGDRNPLADLIDEVYGQFKQGVARGRSLDPAVVDRLAKGRVYTGEQAMGLGLVDRLGGIEEALTETRTALGLAADAPLHLRLLPEREPPWKRLSRLLENGVSSLGGLLMWIEAVISEGIMTAKAPAMAIR